MRNVAESRPTAVVGPTGIVFTPETNWAPVNPSLPDVAGLVDVGVQAAKSGEKAVAAGILMYTLAACGGPGVEPTPQPTLTPTERPSATATFEPTPTVAPVTPEPTSTATTEPTASPTAEPTPTATTEPTPTPTPEATPVTMRGIVDSVVAEAEQNGGFADISAADAEKSYKDAYAADPEAAETVSDPTFSDQTLIQGAKIQWKDCKTGGSGGDIEFAKYSGCRGLLENLWEAYKVNYGEQFISAIGSILNWAENNLAPEYRDQLIDDLRAIE